MDSIDINIAGVDDLQLLKTVGIETFTETFAAVNSAEDMQQYLAKSFNDEKLIREINDPDTAFYLASDNEKIIGYLKLNFNDAQTELKEPNAVEIERIYILKAYFGKKAGQHLFEKALEIALQKKATYIWLGVWEENARAIAFYARNGFVKFDEHIFKLGDDDQTDIMMRLDLSK